MLKRDVRRKDVAADLSQEAFADMVAPETEHKPVRRALTVGYANDPSERQADSMADAAVRNLGAYDEAAPSTVSRQASKDDPLGGAEVAPEVQRQIDAKRGGGQALGNREATAFSDSYGVDLSGVRVHTDSQADTLSRSLQADAFSTGNDVFFRRGKYNPGTAAGDHLIGHELAHVATETPGASRSIHRFMTQDRFFELTYQSFFSSKSQAQVAIGAMLKEYEGLKDKKTGQVPAKNAATAVAKIQGMLRIAKAWIADHEDENGVPDANKQARYTGFVTFVNTAQLALDSIKAKNANAAAAAAAIPEDARVTSLEKHYLGDGVTLFQRAGAMLDKLLDAPKKGEEESYKGQEAEFKIELSIPVPPATVGGFLELKAERDEKGIEAKGTIAITGGGSVGVAELKGALGGFVAAKGKDGAQVGALIEYALYRRCAESNLIPWEAEAYLFGGSADARGKRRAEKRSLTTEKEAFGDAAGDDGDDFYAETGAMASLSAKAGLGDVGEVEGELKGTTSTRTDRKSLDQGKKVGTKNKRAEGLINTLSGGSRGAQESTGRTMLGFSAKAAVTVLGVTAEVEYNALWGANKDGTKSNMKIEKNEIELAVEDVPIEKLVGDAGKEIILKGIEQIQKEMDRAPDEQVDPVAEAQLDAMIDEAKSSAEDAAQEAIEEAGGTFEKSEALGFKLGFDFMERELTFKITKTSGYKVELGVAEVEAKKSETLLKKTKSFKKEDAGKGDAGKGDAAKKA